MVFRIKVKECMEDIFSWFFLFIYIGAVWCGDFLDEKIGSDYDFDFVFSLDLGDEGGVFFDIIFLFLFFLYFFGSKMTLFEKM